MKKRLESCYAIVREDKPPQEWWDGPYSQSLSDQRAKYWTRTLGVRCHPMVLEWPPALPNGGFHNMRQDALAAARAAVLAMNR